MTPNPKVCCRACGGTALLPLGPAFSAPLSTAGWPKSAEEAMAMPQWPIRMTQCALCSHVQNSDFDDASILEHESLKMYNRGKEWPRFIEMQIARLGPHLNSGNTVMEIGHGDGTFLTQLQAAVPTLHCVGIDPAASPHPTILGVHRAFTSGDIDTHRPHLIVIRHVLEHLTQPRRLFESLCLEGSQLPHRLLVYVEVPSFAVAQRHFRCADLLYEHCSHFTPRSLQALLSSLPVEIVAQESALNGEVLWALIDIDPAREISRQHQTSSQYAHQSETAVTTVREQLKALISRGERVVVWGGTGKAASFLNRMGPLPGITVVDSDVHKVGGWVPGLGYPIAKPSTLHEGPAPVVIVPSVWRVKDIEADIDSRAVQVKSILIEHMGRLVRIDDIKSRS